MAKWFGKKYSKKAEKEEWKNIKEVVDAIFEDTQSERTKMTRYLKQFQGEIWDEESLRGDGLADAYKSRAFINLVFSTIESIAPMLTDSRPITYLIPRWPYMEKQAQKYNKGLEYAWDSLDMQMNIYKMVLYGMIMKKGILKVFYDPEKTFGGDLCIENVDPRDFFIAPGYDDIWKAPYCGVKTPKPLSWIRANFPDAGEIEEESSTFKDENKRKAYKYGDASNTSLSARFASVYEVWMKDEETMEEVTEDFTTIENYTDDDGETKEREVSAERQVKRKKYPNGKFIYFTAEKYLGTEPSDTTHELPPYVDFNDYVDPTSFLGMGEVDQIDGLNKELNLQLQAIMDKARRSNHPNYEADINVGLDIEHVKETFFKGDQVYSVDKSFGSTRPAIEEIEFADINKDVWQVFTMIPNIVDTMSGQTDVSKGEASKKERQSASEVAILIESSHTRTRQKVRNLEWTLKRVGYLIVKLMMQYYTEPRTIYTKDSENNINYETLGNSLAQAIETIGPSPEAMAKGEGLSPEDRRKELEPNDAQDFEDMDKLLSAFGKEDPVIFDFDIVIQTNSTLPMDKQSLANLMMRLFQMKAVDAEAVLEILQIPGREKILARIDKQRQAAMQAKRGKPPGGQK